MLTRTAADAAPLGGTYATATSSATCEAGASSRGRTPTLPGQRRVAAVLGLALAAGAAVPALAGSTERVSVRSGGTQGNGSSQDVALSADGRFVAFTSDATDLVSGGTNGIQVFVRDRETRRTKLVSKTVSGLPAASRNISPAISADGRFVAFSGGSDVFVRDLTTGAVRLVSVRPDGVRGSGHSDLPEISADGQVIAFRSMASNLVPGDTGDERRILVRDMRTGTIRRADVGPGGKPADPFSDAPAISADGRIVAFYSPADNLVPGDSNGKLDVFVRDLVAGTTRRVSRGPGGIQADGPSFSPSLSADGRFVAFYSGATNLIPGDTNGRDDVFVRDRKTGRVRRVSVGPRGAQADGDSYGPAISAGGRFVAFSSYATNLVPGDTNGEIDTFVHDLEANSTSRMSVGPGGAQGTAGGSDYVAISADGRVVGFNSGATNLVPGDTNGESDVFIHTR